uniref:Uncharacterized protein n=1 Tax=Picea glauca TaxID=3330 RepID=A0A101M0E4_PICGL|nr:hypothetical protein ABT39_MTgene4647 [Picea glauca]QHR86517.1 hypothetical protein Q903MT_gene519 [Picea sitchensis]
MFVTFTMKSTLNAIASSPGVIHHTTLLNRRPPHIRGAELHTLQRGASTPPYPSQSFEPTHTHFCGKTHTHPEQDKNSTRLSWEGLIYPLPFSGGWNLPLLPSLPKPVNNTTPHYFQPVQGKNTHIQHKKASPHTSLISYSYPIGSHTGVTTHAIQPAIEGRQIPGYTHTPLASNAYTHASPFLLQPTSQYIQTSKAGNPSTHARTSSLPGKHMQCTHQGSAFKLGLHASYHRIHGRKASRPCYDYLGATPIPTIGLITSCHRRPSRQASRDYLLPYTQGLDPSYHPREDMQGREHYTHN